MNPSMGFPWRLSLKTRQDWTISLSNLDSRIPVNAVLHEETRRKRANAKPVKQKYGVSFQRGPTQVMEAILSQASHRSVDEYAQFSSTFGAKEDLDFLLQLSAQLAATTR